MSIPNLGEVIATLLTGAATLQRRHARSRRNARIICYLEDLPAYLRSDIGLPEGVDIGRAVDTGSAVEAALCERHHNLAMLPHAT